jgi:hypothetical protein
MRLVSAVCSGHFIPDTHWIGTCVEHRAILPVAEMKEILAIAGEEPRILTHLVHSLVTVLNVVPRFHIEMMNI